MPLTGTESILKQELHDNILAKMQAAGIGPIVKGEYLLAFCEAVAQTMIAHLVSNTQVNPGQVTASSGVTGSGPPGGPLPVPVLPGATTTPGTIS